MKLSFGYSLVAFQISTQAAIGSSSSSESRSVNVGQSLRPLFDTDGPKLANRRFFKDFLFKRLIELKLLFKLYS